MSRSNLVETRLNLLALAVHCRTLQLFPVGYLSALETGDVSYHSFTYCFLYATKSNCSGAQSFWHFSFLDSECIQGYNVLWASYLVLWWWEKVWENSRTEEIFSRTEVLQSFPKKTRKWSCFNFLSRLSHRQITVAHRTGPRSRT